MNAKKTVVLGASPNPSRYAFMAANMLKQYGHPMVPVGIKSGTVADEPIQDLRQQPEVANVHTVTLYLGPRNQPEWYDYILNLKPERIIFNPGTENSELAAKAKERGIESTYGCTLIMLRASTY